MSNLYFYVIKITDTSENALKDKDFSINSIGSDLEKISFFYKTENNNFWILTYITVPPGERDSLSGEQRINEKKDSIEKILQNVCEKIKFDKMLFGIHGSDWGIEGNDYAKGDIFFPQSIDVTKYQTHRLVTKNFFKDLKVKYTARECKVKLFSHGGGNVNTIHQLFKDNIDVFLTEAKQQEIFSINHNVSTDKKDAKNQKDAISFTTTFLGYDDIEQLDRLETLFFQFRVCLTALKAISGEKDKPDLINRILDELKLLLEGGDLVRRWEEELTTQDGNSLKPNQFTEKCKVFGIGHYLYIFKKDTQIIEDCVNNFSNGSADDVTELIEKLDNVEKAVQEVIEKQREEPGYEG